MPDSKNNWVVYRVGKGRRIENGQTAKGERHFPSNSVGLVQEHFANNKVSVWLIGPNETWLVPAKNIEKIDVLKTEDRHDQKICNICHCLLPVTKFDKNQNNISGVVRRPSCVKCRTDIDKKVPKTSQAKKNEKQESSSSLGGMFFRLILYMSIGLWFNHEFDVAQTPRDKFPYIKIDIYSIDANEKKVPKLQAEVNDLNETLTLLREERKEKKGNMRSGNQN